MGAEMTGVLSLNRTIDDITSKWDTNASGVVKTDVHYSVYVEYGTTYMAAQPYLRPATEQIARRVGALAKLSDGVRDLVERVIEEIRDVAKRIVPVDTGRLKASITAEMGGSSASTQVSASF